MDSWIWGLTCVFSPMFPCRALEQMLRDRQEQRWTKQEGQAR